MTEKSYRVHLVRSEDVEAIMDLLKRTFYKDEPLNQSVGLCDAGTDSCPELDEYCTSSLLEGYSYKAVDGDGNIVGVTISGVCPLKATSGDELRTEAKNCTNPKFKKILHILARREDGAKLWERYPDDQKFVEIKVASTDPSWRRRGIMNALVDFTEKHAKNNGHRLLRLDTSSYYSALSAERLGFTCVYSARYEDIKMDGQPLIVPAPPHVYDRVYIKVLQ